MPTTPTATAATCTAIPGAKDGIINGPDDAWKAVRQHYKDGADVIKIMPSGGVLDESASVDNAQMTIDEIKAVVAAAHDYGFTVAAHAHGAEAIRRAIIGGVDSIEHGTFMDDADMKLMKEHGTWYVPTIIAGKYVEEKAKRPGLLPGAGRRQGAAGRPDHPGDRRQGVQGRRQDRVRHRRRGLSARPEREGVPVHGRGRHAAAVRAAGGDDARARELLKKTRISAPSRPASSPTSSPCRAIRSTTSS